MAAAFSTSARLLATLLLIALSLIAWKWLQRPAAAQKAASSSATPSGNAKKKGKKKTKKKSKKAGDQAPPGTAESSQSARKTADDESNNDGDVSDSDSDSDDGRPAAQVLATRRFKPAALGGAVSSVKPVGPRFELDQRVFARFQGGDAWFPAVVTEVRRGSTYHLRYDDGETEFHVEAALIRADEPSRGSKTGPSAPAASSLPNVGEATSTSDANDVRSRQDLEDGSSEEGNADEDDEDDGWHVVSRTASSKSAKASAAAVAESEKLVDGLTKRQRENRRKKERQREIKELARLQAQSGEINARARMKYVPPPTSAGQ